ncbi:hypothetical protein L0F63_005683 [Massospora cicadina]|nr:hypothetical protein L0F63_005683 [Massospora cicadina]
METGVYSLALVISVAYASPGLTARGEGVGQIHNAMGLGCFRFPELRADLNPSPSLPPIPVTTDPVDRISPPKFMSGLTELGLPDPYSSAKLTPIVCINLCTRLQYPFAALNGDECRCGKLALPERLLINGSDCSASCSGSPRQTCGGSSNFTHLYATGYQPPPPVVPEVQLSRGWVVGLTVGAGVLGLVVGLGSVWIVLILRKAKRDNGRVHTDWKSPPPPKPKFEKVLYEPNRPSVANPKPNLYTQSQPTSQHTSLSTTVSSLFNRRTGSASVIDQTDSFSTKHNSQHPLRVVNPDLNPTTTSESGSSSSETQLTVQTRTGPSPKPLTKPAFFTQPDYRKANLSRALFRLNSQTRP